MGRSAGGGGGGGSRGGGGFSGGGRISGGFSGGGGGRSFGGGGFSGGGGRSFGGGGFGGRAGGDPGMGGGFGGPGMGGGWRPSFFGGWGGPSFGWGGGFGGGMGYGSSGCGCLSSIIGLIVVLMLVFTLGLGSCSDGYGYNDYYGDDSYSTSSYVSGSNTVREKLDSGAVNKTAYYTDEDGSWISDASALEEGLSYFYDKTGVQPYVYILPNGTTTSTTELGDKAAELYDKLFTDEGHFLMVFCDDGNGSYNWGYSVGSAAKSVMDSEALSILNEYMDSEYFDYNNNESQIFSKAFEETADNIMAGADAQAKEETAGKVGIVAAVGAVAAGGIGYVVYQKNKKTKEQQERAEKILNTPLEKFGDSGVDNLASKYEGENATYTASAPSSSANSTTSTASTPASSTPTSTPEAPSTPQVDNPIATGSDKPAEPTNEDGSPIS